MLARVRRILVHDDRTFLADTLSDSRRLSRTVTVITLFDGRWMIRWERFRFLLLLSIVAVVRRPVFVSECHVYRNKAESSPAR